MGVVFMDSPTKSRDFNLAGNRGQEHLDFPMILNLITNSDHTQVRNNHIEKSVIMEPMT